MLCRARRWRLLTNVIGQLPGSSRYAEAIAQNDELARALLHVELEPATPRLSTWTPEVSELRVISDRLGVALQYLAAAVGAKYTPSVLARPVTARERAWLDMNLARHRRLTAQLIQPEEASGGLPG